MTEKRDSTRIVTPEDNLGKRHAKGIEDLLAAFGSGDFDQVRRALQVLCDSEEIPLGERTVEVTRELHARMQALRGSLSPSTISMTTTNIPDAIRKLEEVMSMTNVATHKLLGMVDQFESLLLKNTEAFEKIRTSLENSLPIPLRSALAEYTESQADYHREARQLLSEMVMSQEFQDLCGQSLAKILRLIRGVESELGQLLPQFGLNVEPPSEQTVKEEALVQDGVDDILKGFGF